MIELKLQFETRDALLAFLNTSTPVLSQPEPSPAAETEPEPEPAPAPKAPRAVHALPSAIELAAEHRIDLWKVTGTGKDGRITKKDVQQVIDSAASAPAPEPEAQGEPEAKKEDPPAPAPAATGEPPEANACRDALVKLQESAGLPACFEALAKFGVERVSQLEPDKRAEFIAACDAAAA